VKMQGFSGYCVYTGIVAMGKSGFFLLFSRAISNFSRKCTYNVRTPFFATIAKFI
jgi:hypothetical protein